MSQRPPFRRPEPPPPSLYPAHVAEYRQAMQDGPEAVRRWCAKVDAEEKAAGEDRPGPKYLIALAHFAQFCAGAQSPEFASLPNSSILALCESHRFAAVRDTMRNRPIHLAAGSKYAGEMARVLCRALPECVSMPNSRSEVAAHIAAGYGSTSVLKAIIAANPKTLRSIDSSSRNPAFAAAHSGRHENLAIIAEEDPKCFTQISSNYQSVLHAAVIGRSPECVDLLLKHNPSLAMERDEDGVTPLALNALHAKIDGNDGKIEKERTAKRLSICQALLAAAPETVAMSDHARRQPYRVFGESSEHPIGALLFKSYLAHKPSKAPATEAQPREEPAEQPEPVGEPATIAAATAEVDRIGTSAPARNAADNQLDLF